MDHVLGNDPARNPEFLKTLHGLWVFHRLPAPHPGRFLWTATAEIARLALGQSRLRFILVHHCLVRFCGQVGQIHIIDEAVANRAVIGHDPVADDRRSPVVVTIVVRLILATLTPV